MSNIWFFGDSYIEYWGETWVLQIPRFEENKTWVQQLCDAYSEYTPVFLGAGGHGIDYAQ